MLRTIPFASTLLMAALAFTLGFLRSQPPGASIRAIGAIQPRISPDGTSIAVSYQGAIWTIGREGGEMRRLTSAVGFDSNPAWSPDGKRISYFNGRALRMVDAGTASAAEVPNGLQGSGDLYFNPDGRRILGNFGQPSTLSWVDVQSGTLTQVMQPAQFVGVFGLSPDGTSIAYVMTQDVSGEQTGRHGPQADVWVIPSRGGEPKKLVQFRSRVYDLWWGGTRLIVASDLGGAHNDLWTISLNDPLLATRLTSGQADEDGASVSADGRWLVYTDNRDGATALVRREVDTGAEQTLPLTRMDFGAPTGTITLGLAEKGTGEPVTARVSVQQKGGKYFAPAGALYWMLGSGVEHFYAAGSAQLTVPAGSYVIRGVRGVEYLETRVEVDVAAGGEAAARLELERWTNPPARGWWGGESHIHASGSIGSRPSSPRVTVSPVPSCART